MEFAIVEIKEKKDTYVIYDMENKGVCCCSSYTIKQLLDNNHTVHGARYDNGRLKVSEVDLQGNLRTKKSGVICKDATKRRSMVTILKGLDEKHYPREIKSKRGNGSYVSIKIRRKDNKDFKLEVLNGGFGLYKEFKGIGIQNSIGGIVTSNGVTISAEYLKVLKTDEFSLQVRVVEVEEKEKELLDCMYDNCEKLIESNAKLDRQLTEINKQLDKLELERLKLKEEQENLIFNIQQGTTDTKKSLYNECIKYKYSGITGEELEKYSFFSKQYCTVDAEYIQVLLSKTKRPILYTYGLKYRNPTTKDKKITNEQAVNYFKSGGMIDVDATDPNVIYMNEYSANDMW